MKQLPANWWLTWLVRARTLLVQHQSLLNRINVFPVADADTGANLVATVGRAADSAGMADNPDFSAAARAALRGARGNSGTLVSVWLLGLATELEASPEPTSGQLQKALVAGALRARTALNHPAEGTALTVMETAATAHTAENMPLYLGQLVETVEKEVRATAAAEHARNGWVDSGALGVLLLITALQTSATGQAPAGNFADLLRAPEAVDLRPATRSLRALGQKEPQVEVMCDIYLPVFEITQLRSALDTVGDSVSVAQVEAGNEALWAIHVHVPTEQDALRVLTAAGQPLNLRVTALDAPEHAEHHEGGQV